MKKSEKIISFVLAVLCFIGAFGGIGYTIYNGAWMIAIGVAVLTYTAWPKFKDYIVKLTL